MDHFFNAAELRTEFVRQRRNLILTSLVLLCLETIGLNISKINLMGNEFILNNSRMLPVALWVVYLYFLLRYYQYFHDIKDRNVLLTIRNRYYENMNNYVFKKGIKDFENSGKHSCNAKYDYGQYQPRIIEYSAWKTTLEITSPVIVIEIGDKTRSEVKDTMGHRRELIWYTVLRCRIQALLHVCFRTRFISEYYLPFIIAIMPIAWKVIGSHWLTTG